MLPAAEASSVDKPAAIAVQNLLSSLRPAVGGLPGEGNGALPERSDRRFHLVIVAPHEALRRPLESALPESVPSAVDLLSNERDRKILRVLSAAGDIGKPLVAQVSVPQERVQILRTAFAAMVKDPAFLADAEKTRQVVSPTLGDAAVKIVDEIYSSPKDIIEAARAIAND